MHTRRTLTPLIGVGALASTVLTVGPAVVAQASPGPRTWYVAQSGSASFGTGTSCAVPDVVGTDDTAIRTALSAAIDDDTVAICDGVYAITRTLSIDDSIAIQGQSTQGTVLDGGGENQILRLEDAAIDDTTGVPEVSVVVQDLTFRDGDTGANGTDACNTQSQCGGAIYVEDESNLTVRRSYFLHNHASFVGGAIANHGEANYFGGDIRIYDSTFESNTGDFDGGAVGIAFNFIPGLTVVNSTFVHNHALYRAGGAIGEAFASGTIDASTFVDNQAPGDSAIAGGLTVTGSVIAASPDIPGNLCTPSSGTFTDSVATSAGCGTSTVVSYSSLNLRGLGWWGGPTPTEWIGPGSSAINANTGVCQSLDQRGAARSSSPCDAGAYERQGPTDETVTGTLNYPAQVGATQSVSPLSYPSFGGGGRSTGFTSLTPTRCSVDDTTGLVTGVESGTCSAQWYLAPTIAADGAAFDDTLSVIKSAQAPLVIVPPGPLVYGQLYPMSTTGGSGSGSVTFSTGASTGCTSFLFVVYVTDVSGTCVITASKAADATYDPVTSAPITVQMVKADQAPLAIIAPLYLPQGSAVELSTTGGETGGPVTYTAGPARVCVVNGALLRMIASAGECRVEAEMAGDTNFNPVQAPAVLVEATSPVPPDPTLVPGAPTGVTATRDGAALRVSWTAPTYGGAFPISHYLVESSPQGGMCVAPAPHLTCEVSGLRSGTSYTVTVRALNGIGWSLPSTPVKVPSITITGSRTGRGVSIAGVTTGLAASAELTPWIRLSGSGEFDRGRVNAAVSSDGTFAWSRRAPAGRTLAVYFEGGGVRSNTVVLPQP